ncbi:hypothetical protein ACWEOE_08275 [Amycolatopsis sp. NPDC004368]
MSESTTTPARRAKFSWASPGVPGKIGLGAVAAAAVAAAVVATSVPQPQAQAPASVADAPAVTSPLVSLAANVTTNAGSVTGDASLVIRSTKAPDGSPYVVYSLYTDKGEVYLAEDAKSLPGVIASHANLAEPNDAADVAAARFAATGDLNEARTKMVNATPNGFGLGLSDAAAQKAWADAIAKEADIYRAKGVAVPTQRPTGKTLDNLVDNHLWTNAVNALNLGAANPQVRAGVLRLLSTIPDVTVTKSTTDGKPTLTITAGAALFSGEAEVLTVDAATGLPVSNGSKSAMATYKSSRVTVADVQAGKF